MTVDRPHKTNKPLTSGLVNICIGISAELDMITRGCGHNKYPGGAAQYSTVQHSTEAKPGYLDNPLGELIIKHLA